MVLNKTQLEIIGLIFGYSFIISKEDIFLAYIAPKILETDLTPQMPAWIGLLSFFIFLGSILVIWDIFRMIKNTYNLNLYNLDKFYKYLVKLMITLFVVVVLVMVIKAILF